MPPHTKKEDDMKKKYKLSSETKIIGETTLHRIIAIANFSDVKIGDKGGWIESENNLRQDGDAWVFGNACVFGNARVFGNACVFGNARVCGDARVSGDACVGENKDYFCVKGAGSENRNTTFFMCNDGEIRVNCGCFNGTLEEFKEEVHKTHSGTKFEREYIAIINLVKIHFEKEEK